MTNTVISSSSRHYDVRTISSLHTWKLQFPTGGTIRYLASAENWIAVGNHNGHINTLDVRTGELLSSWKPSDFYPNPVSGTCIYNLKVVTDNFHFHSVFICSKP